MEAIEGLSNEAFNVLTVLASGVSVAREDGSWRVNLPPAKPGGSTAVSDEAMSELRAQGLISLVGDRMEVTPLGRSSLFGALGRWGEEALAIPLPA